MTGIVIPPLAENERAAYIKPVSYTHLTYRILSEHPNIRGTKEASGNLSLIARTAALCGQGFDIYSGNDDQTVPIMSLGGKGVCLLYTSRCV